MPRIDTSVRVWFRHTSVFHEVVLTERLTIFDGVQRSVSGVLLREDGERQESGVYATENLDSWRVPVAVSVGGHVLPDVVGGFAQFLEIVDGLFVENTICFEFLQ
ncbi:hypothetical protein [Halorussus sp. MSC15.2]|uniref:hypothetical protein n=1 Tax=Halorussus sp. MSC15.2 TaxID=2283638 RepID=UPI0013D8407A|nr:hypothetical protein [Halorussus sp. MSC15.2]NEU58560.1 hypothetical protein [Halorussus sp. MSC15.2]